jgi:uncharacterized membrane protein YfcA
VDWLVHRFAVSGVETNLLLPPLVMFVIATLTSMGGVTGAFVLVPFNMSVFGYATPGVSATNFVYNIVAVPLGVVRHVRAARMCWPLFGVLTLGTLPGIVAGYAIRVSLLPDATRFRPFVAAVLAYLAWRLLRDLLGSRAEGGRAATASEASARIHGTRWNLRRVHVETGAGSWEFATRPLFLLALVLGVVGGAYGVGGGSIAAPFCIGVLGLPSFIVAGATLLATWASSVLGVLVYSWAPGSADAAPDWLLGALYGIGGMAGIYLGARLQGLVPEKLIKAILAAVLASIAARYLWQALG